MGYGTAKQLGELDFARDVSSLKRFGGAWALGYWMCNDASIQEEVP
jgi:hypothetical protein